MTPTPFGHQDLTGEILATLRRIEAHLETLTTPKPPGHKPDHKHTYVMGGSGACVICGDTPAST